MRPARSHERATGFDRLLTPVHRWIWRDAERRVQKLLRFGETETEGGRDILRAAEVTADPLLRRLYLVHAIDELRHGVLFRRRAASLLPSLPATSKPGFHGDWLAPGGHGLDDLQVDKESDDAMLAFLHLSEKAAASRFTVYRDVLRDDPPTCAVFDEILHDETFHMNYTLVQLARVSPHHQRRLWRARFGRVWKAYLRVALALAGAIAAVLMTIQYFVLIPPFAFLAKRAVRRERLGWAPISPERNRVLTRQSDAGAMKILGISAHYHDSAAALVIDGVPVCAVQEERLSRRKNDAAFPLSAIEWCLERGGVEAEALDAVVFYERPMLKFDRILTCALRAFPQSWRAFPKAMKSSLSEKVWVRGIISSHLGVPARKILFTEHHQSHAATAFLTAPTRRAAILTADGVGEWATLSIGHGERRVDGRTAITLLREIRFPHSLGMLYSTFTAYLGFAVNEDEYKVMGLAGYGRPDVADKVRQLIRRTPDGAFALDLDYFEFHTTARRSYSSRFVELFGPPRHAVRADRSRHRRRPAFRELRRQRAAGPGRYAGRDGRGAARGNGPVRPVSRRRGGVERCRQHANSAGVGLRTSLRPARSGRRRLRARRRPVCRPHSFRQSGSRGARSSFLGTGR